MGELLQPMHVLVLLFVAGTLLIPAIFYILTLSGVLQKCAPASRTIEPGPVWILLIPLVNLVFSFIVVFEMAQTLQPSPGKSLGLAMCICGCCRIIPVLGLLAMLAHLVLWIIYWVKISEYSRMLDTHSMSIAGGHVV